ncbi:MAG: L-2-hydroxyglutarate oxidase [Verrucomicrobia bacterium]|nr:L-2-hydroxyglutarate oxidase [Verrucomicrobiota bacterium]
MIDSMTHAMSGKHNQTLCVVGGGIVGLASALQASERGVFRKIIVLEKEAEVGRHQTGHNSGVLHCGLSYKPGSEKARLAVDGIKRMVAFCQKHDIPHEICGKVVVAVCEEDVARLKELEQRGRANGLEGLRWMSKEELAEREPHVVARAALLVPQEGIVDFAAVARKMRDLLTQAGHQVLTGVAFRKLHDAGNQLTVETSGDPMAVDFLLNCGGLHADRICQASGIRPSCRIIPFRGEYFRLNHEGGELVNHLVYPTPNPAFPFLGVHFTRMIHGGLEAGPNAVLAMKREGYAKTAFSLRDAFAAASWPGLWRFLAKYPLVTLREFENSLCRSAFLRNLQRLVPGVRNEHLLDDGFAGVRAQAMAADGNLLMDFLLLRAPRQLHVLNAPSPGATAALAIGEHILNQILDH